MAAGLFPQILLPNSVFSWALFRRSIFGRFDGLIFETEKLFENVSTTRGLPLLLLQLVRMQHVSTHTCSRQSVSGHTLELSSCILLKKWSLRVQILPSQNVGPEMGPFSEPVGNVPILRGTKNGSEFRASCWSRSSLFCFEVSTFLTHPLNPTAQLELLQIHRQPQQQYCVAQAMKSNKFKKRFSRNWGGQ